MTVAEFWQEEAEREGKKPHEVMQEFYDEIEEDNRNVEEDLKKDALKLLRSEYFYDEQCEDEGECCLAVKSVLEILESHCDQNFRQSKMMLKAKVLLFSGEVVTATWSSWSSPGSFYEPPDGETMVEVDFA